jgi:hypothetical protein
MCCQILSHPLVKITMVLLLLAGCNAPAETPVPSTEIPPTPTLVQTTEVPPTPTPPALKISSDTLIGNWQPLSSSIDATFLQINSDGTCRQSYSLDGLTNAPQVECTYIFDGTYFSLTAVKLNGVPECPSPTGKYEVRMMADNQIQLVVTKDTCTPRAKSTRGVYQRIP